MKKLWQRAAGSTFLRHNAVFFAGSLANSALNYLYYPVIGRLLPPAAFGEVQVTISLFLQIGVFLQVLGLVTIGIIKRYPDPAQRARVLAELEQAALSIGIVACIVVLFASVPLQQFLNFSSPYPFMALALSVLVSIPLAFSNSYLQGLSRFGALSRSYLRSTTLKLVIAVALVAAGWGAFGAVFALVVAQIIALVFARRMSTRLGLPPLRLHLRWPNVSAIRPELRYAALVLTTSLSINLLLSLDIIAVKHYFSPHTAGLYAGLATIARIVFYLTGPFAGVLIAAVTLGQPAHNWALLKRSLLLTIALGGATLAAFAIAPQLILRLLMGPEYLYYAPQLPLLGLAMFILSVANLLVFYQVALQRVWAAVAAVVGVALCIGLIILRHATPTDIIWDVLIGGVAVLILQLAAANIHQRPLQIRQSWKKLWQSAQSPGSDR